MKKLFALLLAVMMLFCLCACGNDADTDRDKDRDDDKGGTTTTTVAVKDTLTAKTLEGTWEMRMDIGTLMTSGAVDTADMPEMMDMMDFDEMDLKIEMDVTFKNGKMSFDPAGMANFYKDMINAMLDWVEVFHFCCYFDRDIGCVYFCYIIDATNSVDQVVPQSLNIIAKWGDGTHSCYNFSFFHNLPF